MTSSRPRFPIVLTIACAICLGILLSLGVWQSQRLGWKQGLIARAEAAAARPPVSLYDLVDSGEDPEFRQVTIRCPGLASAPYVELQTIQDGQAGVRLISACPILKQTGMRIASVYLVDRGFVADVISARPSVARSERTAKRTSGRRIEEEIAEGGPVGGGAVLRRV